MVLFTDIILSGAQNNHEVDNVTASVLRKSKLRLRDGICLRPALHTGSGAYVDICFNGKTILYSSVSSWRKQWT